MTLPQYHKILDRSFLSWGLAYEATVSPRRSDKAEIWIRHMNRLNRQHKEILGTLRANGNKGLNSFTYRTSWIQLPVRIKELKGKGFLIMTRHNPDRSVDYVLAHEPSQYKTEAEPYKPQGEWVFEGNNARFITKEESKQEAIL